MRHGRVSARPARPPWLSVLRALVAVAVVAAGVAVAASPAAAAGTITVSPTTGLQDGDVVTITGSGWQPNVLIGYCQGIVSPTPGPDNCGNGFGTVGTDANGNFTATRQLTRIIDVPSAGLIDCADPAAPCVLAAAAASDIPGTVVYEQLHFAPAAPVILPGRGAVLEGDTGTTSLNVPIRLSPASTQVVTASWSTNTVICNADPATDYVPASGTVTFAPGDTEEVVTITVNGDLDVEQDECIYVAVTDPTNAEIVGSGLGIGTIVNDDIAISGGFGSVVEGNSGTTALQVPVTLNHASVDTVTASWATVDGGGCSADPASDYVPASGTVTFAPGDTEEAVTITVNGDVDVEPDECILVSFTNPTNATVLSDGFALILNDDVPLTILPGTASVVEGDSGTRALQVPVTLNRASVDTVTVDWVTFVNPGSPACQADAATDYAPASGKVTFTPGDTEEAVTVAVNGDIQVEANECVLVSFRNATNARIGGFFGLGVGTITNDDPVTVLPGIGSVVEGDAGPTVLQVPVTLTRPWPLTVTVQWVTFVNAGPPPCQPDATTDYSPASGTVTFAPNDTAEVVSITVNGDTQVEADECVLVSFRNATNARIGGFFGLGVGTITNDD
jgi:Neocarzinostatin family/Calx-beta domain